MKTQDAERKFIYVLKAFAVFSIVSAHCYPVPETHSHLNVVMSQLVLGIGHIGVPIFLILAGYLFKTDAGWSAFWRKKIKTLFAPWVFTGLAIYLFVVVRKGEGSFQGFIFWLLGIGTYLYYMIVVVLLYCVYFYLGRRELYLYISIVVSSVSLLATGLGILPNVFNSFFNALNWAVYFAVGMTIRRKRALASIAQWCQKHLALFSVLAVLLFSCVICFEKNLSYWSPLLFPATAAIFCFLMGLSCVLSQYSVRPLQFLGRCSFSIYLLHMPVAGIIASLFNRFDIWWTTPLRPFLSLAITAAGIVCYRLIAKRCKVEGIADILIGYR